MGWYIAFLIVLLNVHLTEENRVGHLQPLGEQRESEGHIEVLNEIPDAVTFYEKYIKGSKPVVFKNAAFLHPAFKKWNDDYLRESFGHIKVDVEEGKKENRSLEMWSWTMKEFIKSYQKDDVYMVNSLQNEMKDDLILFPSISCGGFTNVILDVIMWFSSGGTKSVVHTDYYDNINCLMSGSKKLYMVHPEYQEHIEFDAGSHSHLDVDSVDLDKYPGISQAPWWQADMEAGDCLFIPYRWIHQVRSYAEQQRNMAVNLWFYHMLKFNYTECEENKKQESKHSALNEFIFDEKKAVRFLLSLEVADEPLSYKQMFRALNTHYPGGFKQVGKSIYQTLILLLDKDRNKKISTEDIEALSDEELVEFLEVFPGLLIKEEDDSENLDEDEPKDEL